MIFIMWTLAQRMRYLQEKVAYGSGNGVPTATPYSLQLNFLTRIFFSGTGSNHPRCDQDPGYPFLAMSAITVQCGSRSRWPSG